MLVHILERERGGIERMQRRKDDENIICAVSIRESKEEGKVKFHGNPGRTTMTASLRSRYTQISLSNISSSQVNCLHLQQPKFAKPCSLFTVSMTQLYPLPLLLYDFELLQIRVISSCILIRYFLEKIWTLRWQHSFWLPKHLYNVTKKVCWPPCRLLMLESPPWFGQSKMAKTVK